VLVVKHNGALNLVTLRYRLKDVAIKARQGVVQSRQRGLPGRLVHHPGVGSRRVRRLKSSGWSRRPCLGAGCGDKRRRPAAHCGVHDLVEHREGGLGASGVRSLRDSVRLDPQGSREAGQPAREVRRHRHAAPGQQGKSIVYEQPKLSKPLPYKKSDQFKSFGYYTETDDVRGGMGLEERAEFQKFVDDGGTLMTFGIASTFPASSASPRVSIRRRCSRGSMDRARTCRARS
jgi:hypothetical protein